MTPTDIFNASQNANHVAVLCITGLIIFTIMICYFIASEQPKSASFCVFALVSIVAFWYSLPSVNETREHYCAEEKITNSNIADYTDICITFKSKESGWTFFSNGSLNSGLSDIYDPKNIQITSYNRLYGSFLSNPLEHKYIVDTFSKKFANIATVPDYTGIYEQKIMREQKNTVLAASDLIKEFNTFMLKHNESITSVIHGDNVVTYQNLMSLKDDVNKELKTINTIDTILMEKCFNHDNALNECRSIKKTNEQNKIIADKIDKAIFPLLATKMAQSIKNKETLSQ